MSPLSTLPVSLPFTPLPPTVDAEAISLSFLPSLTSLTPSNFTATSVWRDIYALTNTMRTFYGASSILTAWTSTSNHLQPHNFSLLPNSAQVFRAGPACWIQAIFSFETEKTTCQAIVSLVQDEEEWKIWLLRTILQGLKGEGSGSVDFLEVEEGSENSEEKEEKSHFDCVVVGAGQSGLSVAGRLKALGVRYVVLEKYPEVGDNWKMRYDSCKLHLPRETAHLPFDRTFGPEHPEYLPKDVLAQGYKNWVKKYKINVWTNTKLENGEWSPSENQYTLMIQQSNVSRIITCSHVVIAVGGSGQVPKMPEYPDRELFKGTVLHSTQYTNPSAWNGKHGIIIGTANTAHDVAEDMLAAGLASVTMVQRSPTYVLPAEYVREVISASYNAHIPTTLADQLSWTFPVPIMSLLYKGFHHRASLEPSRFDALEKSGFKLERNGNLAENLFERFGGHYIDVGASAKISQGLIKIKVDSLPVKYIKNGLEFTDGSTLPADAVVFATGFDANLRNQVSSLFSPSIAEKMGDWWGLDPEGEIRGAFRPCGQKGMWYVGGDQSQCRYFSRFVALCVKADVMGVPLVIYEGES
ncbi:flavin-containing monooxygenase [Acephala macrosclerotiorum]|nr:flavin-containing monooxygenase [Acephala macrosclerotiorum]